MQSVSELLARAKAARAPAAPPAAAPAASPAAAPAPPAADGGSRERTPAEVEAFVVQMLRDNNGMRLNWAVAYFVIHFVLGSGALYLALVHVDEPFAGHAGLLRPLAAAGASERAMLGALCSLALSMLVAALAAFFKSPRALLAAALLLAWPTLVMLQALMAAPPLRYLWPAWFAALAPGVTLAVQAFAEQQFVSQETMVIESFKRVRASMEAEAAATTAAAAATAAAERGGNAADKAHRRR